MESSRDDFIIAIRSAFLKKSTKQKFSLLTLVFLSIFIIPNENELKTNYIHPENHVDMRALNFICCFDT